MGQYTTSELVVSFSLFAESICPASRSNNPTVNADIKLQPTDINKFTIHGEAALSCKKKYIDHELSGQVIGLSWDLPVFIVGSMTPCIALAQIWQMEHFPIMTSEL